MTAPPCPPSLPLISKHPNKEVDISVPLTLPNIFKTSKQRDGVTIPLALIFKTSKQRGGYLYSPYSS